MASLSIDTSGAGVADHALEIDYLDRAAAYREYQSLRA